MGSIHAHTLESHLRILAGVLGGVFRSSVSLVVIVVEGTRGIDFLLGIVIAVVAANWIAHHLHKEGIYESELERDGNVFYLRPEPPHALRAKTAAMVRHLQSLIYTDILPCRTWLA